MVRRVRIAWQMGKRGKEGEYFDLGDYKENQSRGDMEEYMLSKMSQKIVAQMGEQGRAVRLGRGWLGY